MSYAAAGPERPGHQGLEQFQQYDDGANAAMTDQAAQLLEQLKGQ